MLLDYTEKESSLLQDIAIRYNEAINNIQTQYKHAKDTENDKEIQRTQSEYSKLLSDYGKKRKAIEHRAETRETKYFSAHTKELALRLKTEIEIQIASFGALQNHAEFLTIYQNDTELKKRLTDTFGRYLDILKKYDMESYQSVISFIDGAINEKEGITQAFKTNLEDKKKILRELLTDEKAQPTKDIEKATAIRAMEFFAPVDKISQTLTDRRKNYTLYENPEVLIRVGKKDGKQVTTLVSVNIDELQGVTLGNDTMLNPYNRAIHNIAVSLYAAGNTHITPRMIYEAINGYRREHKPPEQVYETIMASMRKLMYTAIKIDATEEAKAFGLDKLKFEGHLLPVVLTTAEINGQEIKCFKFVDEPPLYTYASKKKQISRCNIKLLAVDLNMTPENVVIRDYLLEQITSMQSKKSKLLNVIRYDTLYEYLGVDAPTAETLRAKKRDIRAKVRTILNAWVREDFIAGYVEEHERSSIAKVRIILAENT